MQVHVVLETLARYLFCSPLPIGWTYDSTDRASPERALHVFSAMLDLLDVVNTILDVEFAIALLSSNEGYVGFGCTMLLGIALARYVARQGNKLMYRGGILWAPFFQDAGQYYSSYDARKKRTLCILYCLTFTELSVFFFEDATTILIWLHTGSFDRNNKWELINSWMTLVSAVAAMSLLWISMLYSVNCHWCRSEAEDSWRRRDGLRQKCLSGTRLFASCACKLVWAILFVLFFFVGLVSYFAFLIWAVHRIVSRGVPGLNFQGFFYILVVISWALSSYFLCKFRRRVLVVTETETTQVRVNKTSIGGQNVDLRPVTYEMDMDDGNDTLPCEGNKEFAADLEKNDGRTCLHADVDAIDCPQRILIEDRGDIAIHAQEDAGTQLLQVGIESTTYQSGSKSIIDDAKRVGIGIISANPPS